jgi:alcohol dehydrogenase
VRAIRFDGSRIGLEPKAESPVAAAGEAVLRPLRVAVPVVPGSDGGPAASAREPVTLGSEFVAMVESLGEGADRDQRKRWEGKRTVGSPEIVCGRCDMCKGGLPNHCRSRRTLGSSWDGCLAERFKLPLRNLTEVPPSVSDDQALFASALGGALHAATMVRIEGKPYVTVLGDGVDALLCAQVMVRLNASVRVLGSRPEKFTLCEKWGIKHRHNSEAGRRHDQDIVVECTGTGAGFALAMQLVRPRGKIVLRAVPATGAPGERGCGAAAERPPDLSPLVEHELEVLGARCGNPAEAMARLAGGDIDVLPLITRRVKFADALRALPVASAPEQLKVLVEFSSPGP